LLIGIDGQGIWEISKKHNKLYNIYKENADNHQSLHGNGVYDIFCDDNNRVWISTYSGGLSFFDQKTTNVTHITHRINISNSLSDNNINKIIEDKRGQIWFATNNGLCRYDGYEFKTYKSSSQFPELLQSNIVNAIVEDIDHNLWIGTEQGLHFLDKSTDKIVCISNDSLPNSFIHSLLISRFRSLRCLTCKELSLSIF
jgi:ligand-binding sensor domain-containing protein